MRKPREPIALHALQASMLFATVLKRFFIVNSFRVCAVHAALCLCDGHIIPRLLAIYNIGMLHKFND